MIITSDFIYKEVGFELNCNAKYDNPCPDCGFYYYVDGGMSYDEHCREVVYYNVFLGTEDMESPDKYPIYSIFTGNTQHSMDHKYDNGELYGEDGKPCGHYNENYAYCYNCESVIEKNREESYYDEYGRTVLYKSIRYEWSDSKGEAVLSYVSEEFYAKREIRPNTAT